MHFRKAYFSLFLLALFVIFGCAAPKIKKIPKEVLLEEATEDQFILVDNFDDGKDPNKLKGEQLIEVTPGAICSPRYTKEEAFSRYSIKIDYQLARDSKVAWKMDLNDSDVSAAKKIVFYFKHKKEIPLSVELEDSFGNVATIFLSSFDIPKDDDWAALQLDLEQFRGLDFNKMKYFSLIFEAKDKPINSVSYIDEVKFFGPRNLLFLSLEDNLYNFPQDIIEEKKVKWLSKLDDKKMLKEIAQGAWGYFKNTVDKRSHLVLDYIQVAPKPIIGDYTSPTNIGLYMVCVISAYDLGFINEEEALQRLKSTLSTLEKLPKHKGFLYNYYNTGNLHVTREYISSVDCGWLAAALVVVRQSFNGKLYDKATNLLEEMDFSFFYDKYLGHLNLGFETDKNKFSPYHYGFISSEARIASFIGIGMGDLPKTHWFKIQRTPPKEWDWPSQRPKGEFKKYFDTPVFEGYYTYGELKVVPSWGGSMFEFLMPVLFIDEVNLSPEGLGLNDILATKAQVKLAKEKEYPVWGFSPASNPRGGYKEYGVKQIGITGYNDFGVVTPHAGFLGLLTLEEEAIPNIRTMITDYQIYGEYGPYDSFEVKSGKASRKYLALDQGMLLVALNNYLNEGAIQRRFMADPIAQEAKEVLEVEKFPWASEFLK